MKLLYNGFYKELEELQKEYEDADFGFWENEFVVKENGRDFDASDFLHGFCDSFAVCLSKEFGYELQAIYDYDGNLVHAYGVYNDEKDNVYFIDVRGCTNDFRTFISEFDDFITITDDEWIDIRPFKPNFSSLELTDSAMKLIEKYRWYYTPWFD